MAILTLFGGIILDGCSTVAPVPIESNSIAIDGNHATAGILGRTKDGSWVVDDFFIANFNRLQVKFGKQLNIKILLKGTLKLTGQTMEDHGITKPIPSGATIVTGQTLEESGHMRILEGES